MSPMLSRYGHLIVGLWLVLSPRQVDAKDPVAAPRPSFNAILYSRDAMAVLELWCNSETTDLTTYECDLTSTYVYVRSQWGPTPAQKPEAMTLAQNATAEQRARARANFSRACSPETLSSWDKQRLSEAPTEEARMALTDELTRHELQLPVLCECSKEENPLLCLSAKEQLRRNEPKTCVVAIPYHTKIKFHRVGPSAWSGGSEGVAGRANVFGLAYDTGSDSWTYRETNAPAADCGPNNPIARACTTVSKTFSSRAGADYAAKLNCTVVEFGF